MQANFPGVDFLGIALTFRKSGYCSCLSFSKHVWRNPKAASSKSQSRGDDLSFLSSFYWFVCFYSWLEYIVFIKEEIYCRSSLHGYSRQRTAHITPRKWHMPLRRTNFFNDLGRFPSQNWPPDHYRTSHFDDEIGFFQEFLLKNHLLRSCYLRFDWSGWIVLIKSEILIATGMVWPVSSDKEKAS